MSEKTINTKILLRNDTRANFEAAKETVFGKGEMLVVFEADGTVRLYMGDGFTAFKNLKPSNMRLSDIPLASASVNGLLSKEDFTRLAGIADGAQVNVIESISVNGTALQITNKGVNIVVPTGALAGKDKVAEVDLDDALKEKVNAAAEGNHSHANKGVLDGITAAKVSAWDAAQPNVLEGIKVNGTALTVKSDKTVELTVPTKVSDLTNDSGYLTESDIADKADKATTLAGYGITDAYTKTEIDGKVASVLHYKGTVNTYAELPTTGQKVGDTYNVSSADKSHNIRAGDNVAWDGTSWDVLGGVEDLSAYSTTEQMNAALSKKVDKVSGQRLMTDAEGTKLGGVAAGATKTEKSVTNGNLKINGTEVSVYTLPDDVLHSVDTIILDCGNAST